MNLSELSKQVHHCIFCNAPLFLKEWAYEDHIDPYLCPNEIDHPGTLIWAWVNLNTVEKEVQCLNVLINSKQVQFNFEENCTYVFSFAHGSKFHKNNINGCQVPNLNKNTIENKIMTMMTFS